MTNVTNTENVANNVVNEKVQHSNYGESATISHEPEVGDVYREFGGNKVKIHITEVCGTYIGFITQKKEDWGLCYYSGYILANDLRYENFNNFYTYLGKAKNPITSIFEVE